MGINSEIEMAKIEAYEAAAKLGMHGTEDELNIFMQKLSNISVVSFNYCTEILEDEGYG